MGDKKRVDFGVPLVRRQGQWRVTCSCLDVSCTPALEQEVAHLDVAFASGKMKWRHILFISGILLAPCIKQELARLGVAFEGGMMKRRHLIFISGILVTPTLDQDYTRLGVAVVGGMMKRRPVLFISGILVTPSVEQDLARLQAAFESGNMKRRPTIFISGILITPTTKQELASLDAAFEGGKMKRRPTIFISGILITPTTKQELASLDVAFESDDMKRRPPFTSVLLGTATIKQEFAGLDMSVASSATERRPTVLISRLPLTPAIDQELAGFDVIFAGCNVKRGGIVPPTHTSIEVQPAATHVSGLHRTTEPATIEVTTLLAQRVGSARCRCRRQLDNAAAFERKHAFVVQRTPADLQAHRLDIQRRQRGLQGRLERCQRSAVGVHLHRHFRTPERCGDVHSCVVVGPLFRKGNTTQAPFVQEILWSTGEEDPATHSNTEIEDGGAVREGGVPFL